MAKKAAYLGAGAVLAASGTYVFVYLYRWEWNRAMFAALLFVATEIALVGGLLLERLRKISDRLEAPVPDRRVHERLREARPPARAPFAWLEAPEHQGFNIFVPILMGAGIVASGLAWAVERLARATAGPALERSLARRLGALAWPATGLATAPVDRRDLLLGPRLEPPPGP